MQQKIAYKLKRSKRAKRMRLAVYCDGRVVVTSPLGVGQLIIEKFITDKTQWALDKIRFFKSADDKAIRSCSPRDYLDNKGRSLSFATERVKFYNKIYGFSFNKIFIKNQKTLWGSCSKKSNLNFNYKIVFLPQKQQDYIIAHEMCHLREFNHSQKFWALVEKVIPNYFDIKRELRHHELFYK